MLYQIDQTAASPEEVFQQFWLGQQQASDELREFAERLVLGVMERRPEIDRLIAEAAEHWSVERMAVVDLNVLRLAVYEMLHEAETPPVVVIDETGSFRGDGFRYHVKERRFQILGNVRVEQGP